ncbi:glycosyltransferase family 2 protein [Tranquillimonas alkanivorans]|uniref:Glycosyl transferase family 2 n=1 Tax=Tranquillimonas alkanivorans TaxID=441119 RepID=A0A1I5LA38_9RHOB|nr:glycosyltransferase family 2 protein [Tranquillimonas alkanivorans]SFO94063.1 Glycosyl transferase family 2 [Tranquillimonas alkanivorans]
MGVVEAYRLRLRRKYRLLRAFRKRRELTARADRTPRIGRQEVLLFSTVRNERIRLPYFLRYYREMGVDHFLMVDNGSDDGSADYLAQQDDVSLWTTGASYKAAGFGIDWMNWLLRRHAHGHWALTVDVDEFLVFPFCDARPLKALCEWLEASSLRSFGAMLLDMYPKGPVSAQPYREGQDPFEVAEWFDSGNYVISKNPLFRNLWIQGGPRARTFFADKPHLAPALNKIPLVKWKRSYAYASSTHMLLPRGLNLVYDQSGGEITSGCLLHAKFLHTLGEKAAEEMRRGEHYAGGREYRAYRDGEDADLWCRWSEKYINWRQLEILGLMSKGNWA